MINGNVYHLVVVTCVMYIRLSNHNPKRSRLCDHVIMFGWTNPYFPL